jgi:hypothetical protein
MRKLLTEKLIAPCGMNCGVCKAHLRPKNTCPGCNQLDPERPGSRLHCRLRLCEMRKGRFCFACEKFPCDRLRRLDKRYSTKYGMSEIENLKYIEEHGIRKFMNKECERWIIEEGVFCVHDQKRYPR